MSAADGSVGSVAKVVDHGPNSMRWNLVIVGDGYRAGELVQYHKDVEAFIGKISLTPPFEELWCGINVHRIDVTSTESGADDPKDPACPSGTGATAKTYFDSTFCSSWGSARLERLLTVDESLALSVAKGKVIKTHQVLVIVNSSKYGGSGGSVAVCSTNAQAAEIAIHEMGHSAFGLADEYDSDGSSAPTSEPKQPNVTIDPNRATNKWRDLVAATTPMPSSCNAGCPNCTAPKTPPPAGAVGAYEGGLYVKCSVYRPLPSCYMRDYQPFCPVCARVIRGVLQQYLPPESIALTTPSVAFADIPEGMGGIGVTTYRAIVFDITTCRRLTFTIVNGPGVPFGTPLGVATTFSPADSDSPVGQARLWISYTSTTAGATAKGKVTVRCSETGQEWTIPIAANTVPRPRSAVALVLDHSGSMAEEAGDGNTKVQKLREAAGIFVDAMLPGDGIGLVRFDDTVQRLMNVEDVGPLGTGAGRATAIGLIKGPQLDPLGGTSIGGGVREGREALDAAVSSPAYDVKAMLVLTDGVENTTPKISEVASSINANTFAIGLGLPFNISTAALNQLTQGHNGYLLVTGTLPSHLRARLTKYFLQILAGITNANVVLDPHGELAIGAEHRIPFILSDADYGFDAFVLTPVPGAIEYELETPSGERIDPGTATSSPTMTRVVRDGVSFYRSALPALPADADGSHAGIWHVVLKLRRETGMSAMGMVSPTAFFAEAERGVLPYDVLVHTYSNLVFRANAFQKSQEPGAQIRLSATLREYEMDVGSRAEVWAEVSRPDGGAEHVGLVESSGQYVGGFVTAAPGLYEVRVRAQGQTFAGETFTREQMLTVVAVPGGDRPSRVRPRLGWWGRLCRCLCCCRR